MLPELSGWTSKDSMGSDDELKAMLMELRMPRKRARTRQRGSRKQDGCRFSDSWTHMNGFRFGLSIGPRLGAHVRRQCYAALLRSASPHGEDL